VVKEAIKKGTYKGKTFFGVSDGVEIHIFSAPEGLYEKIKTYFNTPVFRASHLDANYRFLNYLEETGLLPDDRDEKGEGWRKFTLTQHLYILIIIELRKYGMKADAMKPFAELFFAANNMISHYMIMAVLGGVEMTLIFQHDGTCAILDPAYTSLYKDGAFGGVVPQRTSGEIQLQFSYFLNQTLEMIGKTPVTIKHSYDKTANEDLIKGGLSSSEIHAVLEMRALGDKDRFIAQRTSKEKEMLFNVERDETENAEYNETLLGVIGEGFGELNAIVRDGKLVSIKKRKTTKVNDEKD